MYSRTTLKGKVSVAFLPFEVSDDYVKRITVSISTSLLFCIMQIQVVTLPFPKVGGTFNRSFLFTLIWREGKSNEVNPQR